MPLVLFDIDGTLVDSRKLVVEAKRRAFVSHGMVPPDEARALSVVGLSPEEAFLALVGEAGPHAVLAAAYKTAWHAVRFEPEFGDALFPGAEDHVSRLFDAGVPLGIATGRSRSGVDHLLERQGWKGRFATIQTEDDAPSKPAPDMVENALLDVPTPREAVFMIGDTTFDMEMARAAGVRAVGVSWGYHTADMLRAAGAELVAEDFAAILAVIGLDD